MEWLNYHHLNYFWSVTRHGSITAACDELRLSPSTVSAQLKQLEDSLGHPLFHRVGRGLVPTDFGRSVFRFADSIFTTGRELMDFAQGRQTGHGLRLELGAHANVPKLVVAKLLEPTLDMDPPVRLLCREDRTEGLLSSLSLHHLDVVVTDSPVGPSSHVKAFNHLFGECPVALYGIPALVERYRPGFPASIEGAPLLVPTAECAVRLQLDQWLDNRRIAPVLVGEIEDSGLLKELGGGGLGLIAAPTIIEEEIAVRYDMHRVGIMEGVKERFYAITGERTIAHPAVVKMLESARLALFRSD
ncbi:MAG: LysR family transcriptional regulator [Deltaproteobacteria bacterium]|nr:LysR family transcriptional regulator [Deltaproteobacteria bacterium]MCB9789135.1 LysR family transcriptional regulator [Deltaproteobacteria bacterium]